MVNLGDDSEPADPKYKPDGGYIPRILYFHPDGSFLPSITNADGNPKYKYYHFSTESVADSMEQVDTDVCREKEETSQYCIFQVLELAETWDSPEVKDEL